jgi:hypothetical protein
MAERVLDLGNLVISDYEFADRDNGLAVLAPTGCLDMNAERIDPMASWNGQRGLQVVLRSELSGLCI